MMTARTFATCFAMLCAGVPSGAGEDAPQGSQPPFYELRRHETEYAGPGRDDPSPQGVDEVLLGYFGPSDPDHPEGGDMWLAARWAVEEANREGGYRGKPLRIVPVWSENPWGSGVGRIARLVYDEKVWAIVGGIDGASTHLAEQVTVKARLPLLSPASTDKTVNLANVPWMFSLVPGDHLQAPVLAAAAGERLGQEPLVLVSAVDHDSALFATEFRKALAARHVVLSYHFKCHATANDAAEVVDRMMASPPQAVAIVAGADPSARLVVVLRKQGFTGAIFGGPAMGRRKFQQEAGDAAEGVLFPLLYDPAGDHRLNAFDNPSDNAPDEGPSERFAEAFRKRHGHLPDYAAAHTYDAFRLLVAALRTAGLNRARIRDALKSLSPYSGVTGTIRWDPLGSNTRPVSLGTIRRGRATGAENRH
jgi:branched-chain amino acid transport system substrate-binding protein